jgi:small-conductance mechanosensitive channel
MQVEEDFIMPNLKSHHDDYILQLRKEVLNIKNDMINIKTSINLQTSILEELINDRDQVLTMKKEIITLKSSLKIQLDTMQTLINQNRYLTACIALPTIIE